VSRVAIGVALVFAGVVALAQGLYKYRDEQGNWVYTDRRPDDGRQVEQLPLANSASPPEVTVTKRAVEKGVEIVANNGCFCPVEVAVSLLEPQNLGDPETTQVRMVAGARRETVLMTLTPAQPTHPLRFGFQYYAVLGEPQSRHQADEPYRAPFALARSFKITQAFPTQITHRDPASTYAVDIDMPVGTQVYAARAGTVIEVASQFFEGGADPQNARNANIIRVLHPDGTMAVYAHLNWDSIRVKPGKVIRRGEYIADSGNTGFTTGPHLHFAVQHNAGLRLESLPIEFEGQAGARIEPKSGEMLTAY
jgi:murein DD-endopeptidase MepM/ murein hydrolase activator NlpD